MTAATMSPQAPNITIRTSARPGTWRPVFELSSPTVRPSLSVQLQDADVVRRRYARFGQAIGRAVAEVGQRRTVPPATAGKLLDDIARAGRIFLSNVLRHPNEDDGRLLEFFEAACPAYQDPAAPVPLIQVVADPEDHFPWELLPMFDSGRPVTVDDAAGLSAACRVFPAFSAIVERPHSRGSGFSPVLDAWNGLPLRMICDASYEGVRMEIGFFRSRAALRLDGPYPRVVDDPQAPSFAQQIADPWIGCDGAQRGYSDQIVHIACHCTAAFDGDSDGFTFHLADYPTTGEVRVRLDDFDDELMRYRRLKRATTGRPAAGADEDMPFVFLNACGTAAMDPSSASSFLRRFHDNRNRGVIATAGNVPDLIAAQVSRWFYTALLTGAPVGVALHQAKWRLLEDRGNPLGLLYSLHAPAEMRALPIIS